VLKLDCALFGGDENSFFRVENAQLIQAFNSMNPISAIQIVLPLKFSCHAQV
jgi:hypothetical protein